ncbi:MAG: aromatic ring-hydroxylating dioxygenase subunit alpha, partial [Porticoccaceae bacterium]|nr:aromatic ring-hydroxylating dioxygenase subunit alpha [Porticoccaceae bacterium]
MTENAARDADKEKLSRRKMALGRNWDAWPDYEAAEAGLHDYWYPVLWGRKVKKKPVAVRLCGKNLFVMRDQDGNIRAL